LLGHYENFPEIVHSVETFTHHSTNRTLQRIILRTLEQLNHVTHNLDAISSFSTPKCQASFEFGVAEGPAFNYLDNEELERFRESIKKQVLQTLDFFCVVRYHILEEGRRVPLRFDYHLLRFVFTRNKVEVQVSHERGIRRVSPQDLTSFIIGQIRSGLSRTTRTS
jgi:hypothetical protein